MRTWILLLLACATTAAEPVAHPPPPPPPRGWRPPPDLPKPVIVAYRRTVAKPPLVPGSTLHVAGVACEVHVEASKADPSVAAKPPIASAGTCRTYNMHGMLEQMPTTRWLAASFKIVFDEPTSREAANALDGWKKHAAPPKDRVLIVLNSDDSPPVYDDGCRDVPHPCDPGPRRVIDDGHHQTIQLYVLGTGVPNVIDPSAPQPLGLLGWERIELDADLALPAGATRDAPAGLGAFMHAP